MAKQNPADPKVSTSFSIRESNKKYIRDMALRESLQTGEDISPSEYVDRLIDQDQEKKKKPTAKADGN